MERRGSRGLGALCLAAALVASGCAAPAPPSQDERVRENCRASATVTERLLMSGGLGTVNGHTLGGPSFFELKRLEPNQLAQCLRANGVPAAEVASDLELASRQADCRNRAMKAISAGGASSGGAVQLVFEPTLYDACLAAQ